MHKNTKIIALNGPKGVGKTTTARALEDVLVAYGCVCILSFADPIKKMARAMGVGESALNNPDQKEEVIEGLGVTPRHLLQTLGTEWGRKMINERVWLWAMERQIELEERFISDDEYLFVIIDDCRFQNEADWINEVGGIVVNLFRDGIEFTYEHASEMPLEKGIWGYSNCGDMEVTVSFIETGIAQKLGVPELI